MGFFSWKTQDTEKSIANQHSSMPTFTVYMMDDKGNIWKEDNYDGYGEFGGKDYYELLAEMNGLEPNRDIGIDLFYGNQPFIAPNLVENGKWKWENRTPVECPNQGFFYTENDDDDYDEDY